MWFGGQSRIRQGRLPSREVLAIAKSDSRGQGPPALGLGVQGRTLMPMKPGESEGGSQY